MHNTLDDHALDQIFRTARTHSAWLDEPVPDDLLRQVYELARWARPAPTCRRCAWSS